MCEINLSNNAIEDDGLLAAVHYVQRDQWMRDLLLQGNAITVSEVGMLGPCHPSEGDRRGSVSPLASLLSQVSLSHAPNVPPFVALLQGYATPSPPSPFTQPH
jgi:hypothetical protein